jgi:hypothetical protein
MERQFAWPPILAALVVACVAEPAACDPAPSSAAAPTFDPLDAAAVRGLGWDAIEQMAFWTNALAAGPRDQPSSKSIYRALKKANILIGDSVAELSLEVSKDDPGRHRVIATQITPNPTRCASLRGRLADVYGSPAALRKSTANNGGGLDLRLDYDDAQWPAGLTMITQACATITLKGRTMYFDRLELEPAAGAPRLEPLIVLNCPGLDPAPKAKTDPALTFDPREQWVLGANSEMIGPMRLSADQITFDLLTGDTVRIDRLRGDYTVARSGGSQIRQGVCTKPQS